MEINENMDSAWEAKEAAFLASLPKTMPYRVPEGYFNNLNANINRAVFLDGLIKSETSGFKVPENYFEDLNDQIQSKIAVATLKTKVQDHGFKTPVNYFDQLQTQILSKTSGTVPKTKVIKLWYKDAMKYVAAACFFVVITSVLYLKSQNEVAPVTKADLANEQMLYDIDENVIFEHIEESQTASTNMVSDTEMENYILDNFTSNDIANNL